MIEDNLINLLSLKQVNVSEKNVLERLLDRYRWPFMYPWGQPSVEAILEDGSKHQKFFSKDGYLDSEECIKCYQEGYTLILSNIGCFSKDTWDIQDKLNKTFKTYINCNFYFGNGKKSISFDKHRHEYPVIVKNIYGSSKWIIDEKEVILKDQDCIFFNKDIDHQVVEINNAKLSMTCNIEF